MAHTDLKEFLRSHPHFETRRKMMIFSELRYKPSDEKVEEGFRYFDCELPALLEAFGRGDFEAIGRLEFCLDDEGDPDTSAVCLNIWYTESGTMVAAQPEEYQNHNPVPVAPTLLLEGEAAKAMIAVVKTIDQSR